jgi:hypothetical protein
LSSAFEKARKTKGGRAFEKAGKTKGGRAFEKAAAFRMQSKRKGEALLGQNETENIPL